MHGAASRVVLMHLGVVVHLDCNLFHDISAISEFKYRLEITDTLKDSFECGVLLSLPSGPLEGTVSSNVSYVFNPASTRQHTGAAP